VGGALVVGLPWADLKALAAQVRATGKPPFNGATLDELLSVGPGPKYNELVKEAETNLMGFLQNHFTLTPVQEKLIAGLTPEELGAFRKGMQTAVKNNLQIRAHSCSQARGAVGANQMVVANAARMNVIQQLNSAGGSPAVKAPVKIVGAARGQFAGTLMVQIQNFPM
jgi:hypothetical protein